MSTMHHGLTREQRTALDDVLAAFTPQQMAYLSEAVPSILPGMDLPALTVRTEYDAEWEEDRTVFVCPLCGKDCTPVSVDTSTRWTYADEDGVDAEDRTVAYTYDETEDYHGLAYMHEGCGYVALPEGWTEVN